MRPYNNNLEKNSNNKIEPYKKNPSKMLPIISHVLLALLAFKFMKL